MIKYFYTLIKRQNCNFVYHLKIIFYRTLFYITLMIPF